MMANLSAYSYYQREELTLHKGEVSHLILILSRAAFSTVNPQTSKLAGKAFDRMFQLMG